MNKSGSKRGETAYFSGYTTVAVFVFMLASSSYTCWHQTDTRPSIPGTLHLAAGGVPQSFTIRCGSVCLCVTIHGNKWRGQLFNLGLIKIILRISCI